MQNTLNYYYYCYFYYGRLTSYLYHLILSGHSGPKTTHAPNVKL